MMTLRAKFFWLALFNLAVLGLILFFFIRHQLGQEFRSFLMATAREKIVGVSRQLSLDLTGAGNEKRDEIIAQYTSNYGVEFRLFDADGRRLAGPDTTVPPEVANRLKRPPLPLGLPARPALLGGPLPFLIEAGTPMRYWVGVRTLLPGDERATLLLVSPTLFTNPFYFEWEPWLAILATAIVVTLLCWLPLVRGLTRDIRKMTTATATVADGQFDIQVDTRRGDELGRLGKSINQMAARLRDYLHGQKRFLGDVAHEIRSPLGRMQMALGILERDVPPEKQSYVRDLQEDVEFLSGLTTELLTFARSEMRQEPIVPQPVALQALLRRAIQVEGATAQLEVDPALNVMGDENLLFRALSNIVRNAVRYAGGTLDVTAKTQGAHVILTLRDRGPGVPAEALEAIFRPFSRLDAARDRKRGGTGLGLAIVRSCVEACGGTVHAEQRPGGGFLLVLTLRSAP
jgi:two-component system sensor histidine kinase CpxA